MKGIILAGGEGTRLKPLTSFTSKQLLPVFDKPMIYYPISTLMLAGVKDFLIVSTPKFVNTYKDLLGNGKDLGVSFSYMIQEEPDGIASALGITEDFFDSYSKDEPFVFALGDNILITDNLTNIFQTAYREIKERKNSGSIFALEVQNPSQFGVVNFDDKDCPIEIVEKPENPQSNWGIPGFYIYNKDVFEFINKLERSERGELEISDLNKLLLERDALHVTKFGRSTIWYDAGTIDDFYEISSIIRNIYKRTGKSIGCLEEVAINMNYLEKEDILRRIKHEKSQYYEYIKNLH